MYVKEYKPSAVRARGFNETKNFAYYTVCMTFPFSLGACILRKLFHSLGFLHTTYTDNDILPFSGQLPDIL